MRRGVLPLFVILTGCSSGARTAFPERSDHFVEVAVVEPDAASTGIWAGDEIVFVGSCSSSDGEPVVHEWVIEGGDPATSTSPVAGPIAFRAPGTYSVEYSCATRSSSRSRSATRTIVVAALEPNSYFVDALRGRDTNDGAAPSRPLRSIAALLARPLLDDVRIFLARGSVWREELKGLPGGSRVTAYGLGERPMFDASDVVTQWMKTPGRTNVYEFAAEIGSPFTPAKLHHGVWEDGIPLVRMEDVAGVDATPGTYAAADPATEADVVFVHASDSGDPATSGKLYEHRKRNHGFDGGRYVETDAVVEFVSGIGARRNAHDDGAVITAGYVEDTLADDGGIGPNHAFWVNGAAVRCTAIASKNGFISFGGGSRAPVTFDGCTALGKGLGGSTGWFAHTDGKGSFRRITARNCHAVHWDNGFFFANADDVVLYATTLDPVNAVSVNWAIQTTASGTLYVLGGTYVSDASSGGACVYTLPGSTASVVMRGVRCVVRDHSQQGIVNVRGAGTAADISYSSLVFADPDAPWVYRRALDSAGPSISFTHNLTHSLAVSWVATAGASITSDFNVFGGDGAAYAGGTVYPNLAALRSAGFDMHSTAQPQSFTGDLLSGSSPPWPGSESYIIDAGADAPGAARAIESALPGP